MEKWMAEEVEYLEGFMSERRKARLKEVLSQRTRKLVLVLEDIFDPHNASACVRSAEGMGLQELHIVAPRYPFQPNPGVTNGADKWIDMRHHGDVASCVGHLHERGFVVAAGVLSEAAVPLQQLPFDRPLALVFGNEHEGLSEAMQEAADQCFYIPMLGFSQSFNISVATALAVHYAVNERIRHFGRNGDLGEEDQERLYHAWVKQSVNMADQLLARFREEARA
jgi:tRNA (guanosine-2'-O-)-methyltransferase